MPTCCLPAAYLTLFCLCNCLRPVVESRSNLPRSIITSDGLSEFEQTFFRPDSKIYCHTHPMPAFNDPSSSTYPNSCKMSANCGPPLKTASSQLVQHDTTFATGHNPHTYPGLAQSAQRWLTFLRKNQPVCILEFSA